MGPPEDALLADLVVFVYFCCCHQVAARIAGRLKEERARLEARLEAQLEEERQVRGWAVYEGDGWADLECRCGRRGAAG
jgi:hypothetical protein